MDSLYAKNHAMSELYEGVVVCGDADPVAAEFNALGTHRSLRLVRLTDQTYGIYPVATRSGPLNESATKSLACEISRTLKSALAVFYDNRCDINFATAYRDGSQHRSFNEQDEIWVPLDDGGEPIVDGPQLTLSELNDDDEFDCIRSAIDCGLAHLGTDDSISSATLKQAFCYDEAELIAETNTE